MDFISTLHSYMEKLHTGRTNIELGPSSGIDFGYAQPICSSGHISYAKSARFYVQQMQDLNITQPWLHQQFMNGLNGLNGLNADGETKTRSRRFHTFQELVKSEKPLYYHKYKLTIIIC